MVLTIYMALWELFARKATMNMLSSMYQYIRRGIIIKPSGEPACSARPSKNKEPLVCRLILSIVVRGIVYSSNLFCTMCIIYALQQ